MAALKIKNKLLARMVALLLPAAALPLFCFGYIAIKSHYDSLRAQSLQAHKTMATFMGSQLESDVARALGQLKTAGDNDVYKTDNLFLMREALHGFRTLSGDIATVYLLAPDLTVVAVDPPNPQAEGKPVSDLELGSYNTDGFATSSVYTDDLGLPRFFAGRKLYGLDDKQRGVLVAEVSLGAWAQISRGLIKGNAGMLGALMPTRKRANPIKINEDSDSRFWFKIAELRSADPTTTEMEVGGELHYKMFQDIDNLPARLVVAQPVSAIYAAPRQVLFTYIGIMLVLLIALGVLLFLLARGITEPIRQISDAAAAFSDGRLDARAPVKGKNEIATLAETFNKMGDSLQVSHLRMKVLYKSIMELFACNDVDSLLRKAVELTCTQCQGEVAWFVPHKAGREIAYAEDALFVGLHGWVWKNHRSSEISSKEATGVWKRVDGDRVFTFNMKNPQQEIGVLKVAYRVAPDENMISLLHSLVSLVEMAISKQELIRKGALVTTELEMAEAVQRNIMSDNLLVSQAARVAYHYQPASRLGGDWFFLLEDKERDSLYVIMGDVTGHGLAQGLVTTAVKGALDVIENLVKGPHAHVVNGPAAIVSLLETVVSRVAGRSELTMTCLAAQIDFKRLELKICNAGHTFPILVRDETGINEAVHLHKNQQPILGFRGDDDQPHHYTEATYPLLRGDLLIVYTDGLSEAKNLKSRIFGRFLFRSLRKVKEYKAAEDLKEEILEMFKYYTQNSRVEDDVCFLVIQVAGTKEPKALPQPA